MALRDDLLRALRFGEPERQQLETALLESKLEVYAATLGLLATEHGTQAPQLGSGIRRGLDDESRQQAQAIIDSYNAALANEIPKAIAAAGRGNAQGALLYLEEWSHARAERQAPVVAVSATYASHADAQITFFTGAGLSPLFDFGGHGDAAPVCVLCQAILARNPHPIERVLAIGTPHHLCRQSWHPVGSVEVPADYVPGLGQVAGIVGRGTLSQIHGSNKAAAAAVEAMQ